MSEEWKDSVGHIAIDGSRRGVSVRDADCGWAVVQLDYDGEDEPWYVVYVTLLAELDVQRTIKRADVGLYRGFVVSATIHTNTMGIIEWLVTRRGQL